MKTTFLLLGVALCLMAAPVRAADIRLNADQWNTVSPAEQQRIEMGLKQTGALRPEDKIVADATMPAFTEETEVVLKWNPLKDICKIACNVTASAGIAWCTANTGGVGLAACMALVEAAREGCYKVCD